MQLLPTHSKRHLLQGGRIHPSPIAPSICRVTPTVHSQRLTTPAARGGTLEIPDLAHNAPNSVGANQSGQGQGLHAKKLKVKVTRQDPINVCVHVLLPVKAPQDLPRVCQRARQAPSGP